MSDIPLPGQTSYGIDQSLHTVTELVAKRKIGDFKKVSTILLQFKDIPQTFTHLELEIMWASTRAGLQNTGLRISANGVGAGYHGSIYGEQNGAALNSHFTNNGSGYIGQTPAGLSAAGLYSVHLVKIPFYRVPNVSLRYAICHTDLLDGGVNGHTASTCGNEFSAVAAPITRIDLADDVSGAYIDAVTRATLYGIL